MKKILIFKTDRVGDLINITPIINNLKLNDDEKYNFIGQKNKKFDYKFITAVTTTGIFCLPSCRAKKPNRGNVIFFDTNKEAITNGFRACKICKPIF